MLRAGWALLVFFVSLNIQAGWFSKKYEIPAYHNSLLTYGEFTSDSLDPDHIDVFVWNIYKARKKNFIKDFRRFAYGSDLLLIQEAATGNKMEEALSYFEDYRFDMATSFIHHSRKKSSATGTALGSKVEPESLGFLRTKDREPVIKTPKVITYAYYPISGRDETLLVLNIHGLNMTKDSAFIRQINRATSLIESHKGPVIFGGDFNCKNHKRLNHMVKRFQTLGLMAVSFENDKRYKSKLSRLVIDHVYVRGLRVKKAQVLGHLKSSDHKAMVFQAAMY